MTAILKQADTPRQWLSDFGKLNLRAVRTTSAVCHGYFVVLESAHHAG